MKLYGDSHDGMTVALALASNPAVLLTSCAHKSLKFRASDSLEKEDNIPLQGCCEDQME